MAGDGKQPQISTSYRSMYKSDELRVEFWKNLTERVKEQISSSDDDNQPKYSVLTFQHGKSVVGNVYNRIKKISNYESSK